MKKFVIPFFVSLALAAPFCANAVSYRDIINYGRKFFVRTEQKTEEKTAAQRAEESDLMLVHMLSLERLNASVKYENWLKAFKDKDLIALFSDEKNFSISENELNYIINRSLEGQKDPIARDVSVDFSDDGLIKVYGYSNWKNLKGDFELQIVIIKGKNKIYPKVAKARLGKIFLPSLIAEMIVRRETLDAISFLYSGEHQDWQAVVNDQFLRLEYK
jgi:hypothetical protein